MKLRQVFLGTTPPERVRREFPTLDMVVTDRTPPVPIIIMGEFRRVPEPPGEAVCLGGGSPDRIELDLLGTLTQLQRFLDRRNRSSDDGTFGRLLERHRALHDAVAQSDYDHALDTWQWLLRIEPAASFALQAAALLHDVERRESETEPEATQAPARAEKLLTELALAPSFIAHVVRLIAKHEVRDSDAELAALNDADALSFFSLGSAGFLDLHGPAHTRRKLRYSLSRMRPPAQARLNEIFLRPDVTALLQEVRH
jgi:hypothetical protein